MRKRLFIFAIWVLLPAVCSLAIEGEMARAFVGQDLHLRGGGLVSYEVTGEHVLVFQEGFSMSIGANQFSSDRAVVWLRSERTGLRGRVRIDIKARAYLEGNVFVERGKAARTTDLSEVVVEEALPPVKSAVVVRFGVSGEVFVTAAKRAVADPRGLELYKRAQSVAAPVGPRFVIQPGARVPELPTEEKRPEKAIEEVFPAEPGKPGLIERVFKPEKPVKPMEAPPDLIKPKPEVEFRYPVNWAPAGEVKPQVERTRVADGTDIATVMGRIYVWQKQDERGGLVELLADNAVIFYYAPAGRTSNGVRAIYMSGDVVLTKGQRTVRADEIYYDFQRKKAIAVNAVMRNFDVSRGIPIYVRAAKLQQLAENKFAADNITLTSSEFYMPQISLSASSIFITDTTTIDEQMGKISDSSYDAQMRDVRLKVEDTTIFYWPFMRSNLQRPDIPLKGAHIGHDSTWGTSVETRWHLSRLLGLREPEGTDSTLALDYFAKRGVGAGAEIEYTRENYFGRLLGYVIRDTGEDYLGRHSSRRNLKPDRELRGRFSWRHKHFLPYNWQLTTGVGYASDEHFIEGYYRGEFNVGTNETYIHLKRIEDNWGFSLLGRGRINDFADELEELPSGEFHLTGQSFLSDRFTLYSDTQISRLRQRIGNKHSILIDERMFSFASHRTELDMPMWVGNFKVVPFIAGTFGYDDRSGFTRTLVDGSNTGDFGEDKVLLGEAGVRLAGQYWKVYPNVESRLWDLKGLRHIIRPQLTAVIYGESDSVVGQRDVLNVGISQRLQTRRGPGRVPRAPSYEALGSPQSEGLLTEDSARTPGSAPGNGVDTRHGTRTVDWMRLDVDFTWVRDSSDSSTGPDRFIWNKPIVPLRVLSAPDIFNSNITNLQRFEMFGPRRNYFGADYIWRLSDTSAVLSDCSFDMQSGVVQQFNVGFSRLCWPNLSYYVGSRYLREVEVLDEKGSNAFTFAATYVLDPRYTVVFSQQFDFDYGRNIWSEITLIRRYHRLYCGFTVSVDESLDRQSIVFSIWPQGVPELAIGPRRYMGLRR